MFNDFFMFNFSKSTWEAMPASGGNLPSARYDAGFTYASGRLFLFGGRINNIGIAFFSILNWECCIFASLTSVKDSVLILHASLTSVKDSVYIFIFQIQPTFLGLTFCFFRYPE